MTPRQKEAHQRLLQQAEAENRVKTVEAMTEEERKFNPGAFAPGNTAGKNRYAGYKFGQYNYGRGKGHKPKPHQALTVKSR